VGMQPGTLCVPAEADAERPLRHSHAERGNDQARRNVAVFQLIEIIFIQPYHFLLFIRHTGN